MSSKILVINPNSNQAVTDAMDEALQPFRKPGGPVIECITLQDGPFGIESQAHVDAVAIPLRKLVDQRPDADCYVIACYSDPGLQSCRAVADGKPVFGIQECGVLMALARGDRFGVIAILESSIKRHLRYLRQMGVSTRLAGERAAGLTVAQSATGGETIDRLAEVGADLRDLDGAETIVLGCAGMAAHRAALEARLGIPVIDPVQAAVAMAMGTVSQSG